LTLLTTNGTSEQDLLRWLVSRQSPLLHQPWQTHSRARTRPPRRRT
jgi:hypothetical protein